MFVHSWTTWSLDLNAAHRCVWHFCDIEWKTLTHPQLLSDNLSCKWAKDRAAFCHCHHTHHINAETRTRKPCFSTFKDPSQLQGIWTWIYLKETDQVGPALYYGISRHLNYHSKWSWLCRSNPAPGWYTLNSRRASECLIPCHPCETPGWRSWLLTSAWPSVNHSGRLGSETLADRFLSLSHPLSVSFYLQNKWNKS